MDYVFENDNYGIVVEHEVLVEQHGTEYLGAYCVINKTTEVCEFTTTALPEAIFAAASMNHALVNKPWEWLEQKAEPAPQEAVLGTVN